MPGGETQHLGRSRQKTSFDDCPLWAASGPLKLLYLVGQLLRPRDLQDTEHFRRRRQQEVAKIVQCGEVLKFLWSSFSGMCHTSPGY